MDGMGGLGGILRGCERTVSIAVSMNRFTSMIRAAGLILIGVFCAYGEQPKDRFPLVSASVTPYEVEKFSRAEFRDRYGWPDSQYIKDLRALASIDYSVRENTTQGRSYKQIESDIRDRYQWSFGPPNAYLLLMKLGDEPTIRELQERIERVPREIGLELSGCFFLSGDTMRENGQS